MDTQRAVFLICLSFCFVSSLPTETITGTLKCGFRPTVGTLVEVWAVSENDCSDMMLDELMAGFGGKFRFEVPANLGAERYILVKHDCNDENTPGLRVSRYDISKGISQYDIDLTDVQFIDSRIREA
ncbi:unnamed protein product [Auanema sp. JU1783]|nr:unnamed protein product [Auanema sp. JU1783]